MSPSNLLKCQGCGSFAGIKFLDFGRHPICNRFPTSLSSFQGERRYPLSLVFCKNCTLVQLGTLPPRGEVFGKDFNYLSGTTEDVIRYFQEVAAKLIKRFGLASDDWVLDLGSNDGSFLKEFQMRGINVLGVEPAPNPAHIAAKRGIPTINKSFEDAVGEIDSKVTGRLRLITAFNVLAHTDRIHEFLQGIKLLLGVNNGVLVAQSHYLPNLIDRCEYDTIYHEHARYYTLTSLDRLFQMHGLHIFDVEMSGFYGGSFLTYAGTRKHGRTQSYFSTKVSETRFQNGRLYFSFAERVRKNREILRRLMLETKSKGKRIAGVGAPMKASTLLNYCSIDSSLLEYITEVNPLKIGTFTPGTHIKVVNEETLFQDKPDVALILSWNVAGTIMKKLRTKGYAGAFIVPIPEPRITS